MTQTKILIACRIFEDELNAILKSNRSVEIHWIEAALHADLPRLKEVLSEELSICASAGEKIYLLYGYCHPEIDEMCRSFGVERMAADNCIHALLGPGKELIEQDNTLIMTPGWIRAWPGIMKALNWNEVDVRINCGRYRRILLLEPGIRPLSDEEILHFIDLIQVPIEIEPITLDYFNDRANRLFGRS
ncbi:MAG: DUF1638 domain-containing protein [bacterium]